jgi:hypothetical protein
MVAAGTPPKERVPVFCSGPKSFPETVIEVPTYPEEADNW